MNTSWELLKKELAFYGIRLVDEGVCQFYTRDNDFKTYTVAKAIKTLKGQLEYQKDVFKFLWRQTVDLIHSDGVEHNDLKTVDSRVLSLFVFSMKDLAKFVDIFDDLDNSCLKKVILESVSKDIANFNPKQIKMLPNFKISIDWTFRSMNKISYLIDLLRAASGGQAYVDSFAVKTAGLYSGSGVGGPWGNLDLPELERVWPWKDEDENLRGHSKDIRKQTRYRQGLENYNNDGSVGEGFYWREVKNEPYSWYDRSEEEPYYSRYLLSRN